MSYRFRESLTESKRGALILLGLLLLLVGGIRLIEFESKPEPMALAAMAFHQKMLDSLEGLSSKPTVFNYSYNPNTLSDYSAYRLGIPTQAYDRLQQYRSQGHSITTIAEFQQITGVSDRLLLELQPVLRFPKNRVNTLTKLPVKKQDLNTAEATLFQKVTGIGPVLSERIVKYRKFLSGFSVPEQCYEVYGLDSIVVKRLLEYFEIQSPPMITPLSLAEASLSELIQIPYLKRKEAEQIIAYRTQKGQISIAILSELFPESPNKIARLKLYLY